MLGLTLLLLRARGWAQIATAALGCQVGNLFAVSEVPADTQV
jgi:hypothetical protein